MCKKTYTRLCTFHSIRAKQRITRAGEYRPLSKDIQKQCSECSRIGSRAFWEHFFVISGEDMLLLFSCLILTEEYGAHRSFGFSIMRACLPPAGLHNTTSRITLERKLITSSQDGTPPPIPMTPRFYLWYLFYRAQAQISQTLIHRYPCPAPLPSSLPPPSPHL